MQQVPHGFMRLQARSNRLAGALYLVLAFWIGPVEHEHEHEL